MKSLIKIAFFAVITVIVIIVLAKANFNSVIKKPNSENSEKVTLQIEQGESVDSIINKLVNAGILKLSAHPTIFSNGSIVTDRKFGTLSSNGNILYYE